MHEPLSVLMVEDSENDAMLIMRALKKQGFEPQHHRVWDPEAMGRELDEGAWEIILCDYSMPQFTALDALEVARSRGCDLPFIVISGTVGESVAVETMRCGAHDYLMKDNLSRLGEAIRRELAAAGVRRERALTLDRLQHLNRVLRAIRHINQLIVYEKDPDRLIQRACHVLVRERGYHGAWIARNLENSRPQGMAGAGWEGGFDPLRSEFLLGRKPACICQAEEAEDGLITLRPHRDCQACPQWKAYRFDSAACVQMRHGDEAYGFLGVAVPENVPLAQEERSLLLEVAGDLAFALHDLEIDRQRRESEDRWQLITESAADAIFVTDQMGNYLYVNPAATILLGYSAAELMTMNIRDLAAQEDESSHGALFRQLLSEGQLFVELRLKKKDGSMIPVDLNSVILPNGTIYGSCRDLTERKGVERELVRSREQMATLLANLPGMAYRGFNQMGWPMEFVSEGSWEVTGYVAETFVNETKPLYGELIHPDDRDGVWETVQAAVRAEVPFQVEYRIEDKDGKERWVWERGRAIGRNEAGTHVLEGFVADITEQKRAEMDRDNAWRENEALLKATRAVLDEPELKQACRIIFDSCAGLLGVKAGYVALLSPDGQENEILLLEPGGSPCTVDPCLPMPIRGLREIAYRQGQPVFENNFVESPHWQLMPEGHAQLENVLFAPLLIKKHPVGLIGLANKVGGFGDRDVRLASAFGEVAAIALDRHRRRESLHSAHDRLRVAVEGGNIGLWDWNLKTQELVFSPVWKAQLGYEESELEASFETWESLLHPDDRQPTLSTLEKSLSPPHPDYEAEFRLRHMDGSYRWILARGHIHLDSAKKPARMVGCHVDVTAKRDAEIALRENERMLSFAIEQMPVPLMIATAPDVKITRYNPPARDLLVDPNQDPCKIRLAEQREHWPTFHPDGTPYDLEEFPLTQAIKDGKVTRGQEIIIRYGDHERWILASAAPLRDESGEIIAGIVVFPEITEEKDKEKRLRQVESQFLQSQKMESIGILAGGVAHDFNNLLLVILGNCELMAEHLRGQDPLTDPLTQIRQCASRASTLTRQLLAFSRKQVMQYRILNPGEVVANLEKMLRRLIGEDIDFHTNLSSDAGFIRADPGQLEQVVVNLVVNARDAMSGGGRLIVDVNRVTLDRTFCETKMGVQPGEYIALAVTDNGSGMDEQTRKRIFEPFFTTKKEGQGTGLGLSTVYGIVRQSDGHIFCESEPGKGTTFRMYFPAVEEEQSETRISESGQEERKRDVIETVLLAEDDVGVRNLVSTLLRSAGYHVLVARNGGEALLVCRRHEGDIQLLVSDVVMPSMSGGELARAVKEHRPEIKVLFMSGYTGDILMRDGAEYEDVDFLEKPFTRTDLLKKVRKILDGGST